MYLAAIDTRQKNNNLTMLRTFAALAVTFGHSFILFTGQTADVGFGIQSGYFGFMAVALFFGLSGYLVTQSFCNSRSWLTYLESRVLRIFPGLLFANVLTALAVLLFVMLYKNESVSLSFIREISEFILGSVYFGPSCLPGVFKNNPVDCVNGSLWTLGIEFRYYVLVVLLGVCGLFRPSWRFAAFVLFFVALATILPGDLAGSIFSKTIRVHSTDSTFLSLIVAFLMGMSFYLYRDRVPLNNIAAIAAVLIAYFSGYWFVKVVLAVYASFVFGFHPRAFVSRFPQRADLSYGIYIYSFPVQQLLIALKVTGSPLQLFFLTSTVVIPLAWISWTLIESPALKLKGVFSTRLLFGDRRKTDEATKLGF